VYCRRRRFYQKRSRGTFSMLVAGDVVFGKSGRVVHLVIFDDFRQSTHKMKCGFPGHFPHMTIIWSCLVLLLLHQLNREEDCRGILIRGKEVPTTRAHKAR